MTRKKTKTIIIVLLIVITITVCTSLYRSAYSLTVSQYTLYSKTIVCPLRIVQLSDLHNSRFGENNRRLIQKVLDQDPDLILITGDLLNQNQERTDVAEDLIRELSMAAPVYVSFGNHETGHEQRFGVDLRELYTNAGAVVLEYDWTDIEVKGQQIRLGGIYGYCLPPQYDFMDDIRKAEIDFLKEYQKTDAYKILLCHIPVSWNQYGCLDAWDVDCVFAGHVHGGQIRIPFVGGVWGPDQGWFPGKDCGLYYSRDGSKVMVLSRGLGNTDWIPRLNNIPEVVVTDILPADGTE